MCMLDGVLLQQLQKMLWVFRFLERYLYTYIKGTVARDYFDLFFYQTVPPVPIRGVLGIFHFLANFHRVIGLLKRFPSVQDTGEMIRIHEVKQFLKRWIKCICIENNRFRLFLIHCCFKGCSIGVKLEKTSQQAKTACRCPGHWQLCFSPVSRTLAVFSTVNVLQFPVIPDTGFAFYRCPGHRQFAFALNRGICSQLWSPDSPMSRTPAICNFPVSRTPENHISPVSQTTGKCFKTSITPWNFF